MNVLKAKSYKILILKSVVFPLFLCIMLHLAFYITKNTYFFFGICFLKILGCILLSIIIRKNNKALLMANSSKRKEIMYFFIIGILLSIILFNSMCFQYVYLLFCTTICNFIKIDVNFSIIDYIGIIGCSMTVLLLPSQQTK